MNSPMSLMIRIYIVKRKKIKMKYVTLEHKLAATCYPHIDFDTNDNSFETEARELKHQHYLKQNEAKNKIIDEINHVVEQAKQTKNKLDELRSNTNTLKRLSSKEYKASRNHLRKQYQDYQTRHLKLCKEAERLDDDVLAPFDTYHKLKKLLKESGYVLVNKTTSDTRTTTEIWHKD